MKLVMPGLCLLVEATRMDTVALLLSEVKKIRSDSILRTYEIVSDDPVNDCFHDSYVNGYSFAKYNRPRISMEHGL
jgi:hypothetical protein